METKEALRQRFASYRGGLSATEYARRSRQIRKRLGRLPELRAAQVILGYWPLVPRGEIDLRPLLDLFYAEGRTVALPVVTSFEKGAPAMAAHRYEGPACLHTNRWGLAEPAGTAALAPGMLQAVVVPAFGAGCNGHRIGHGRGFYDAFISRTEASRLCPVYDACLEEHIPAEAHDQRLDVIVTETRVLRPTA